MFRGFEVWRQENFENTENKGKTERERERLKWSRPRVISRHPPFPLSHLSSSNSAGPIMDGRPRIPFIFDQYSKEMTPWAHFVASVLFRMCPIRRLRMLRIAIHGNSYSWKPYIHALIIWNRFFRVLESEVCWSKPSVEPSNLFTAWAVVLRNPASWTVSPAGSGMLTYLSLRTTSSVFNAGVARAWSSLNRMWRQVPQLQRSLTRRLPHLERTVRIMCECTRRHFTANDSASVEACCGSERQLADVDACFVEACFETLWTLGDKSPSTKRRRHH